MLRLDRICASIFIVAFALQLPGETLLTFADELIAAILGMLAVADCLFNRAWKRYTLLWAIMSVVTFYAVYSLTWVHYNSLRAIVVDWIIQLKTVCAVHCFPCRQTCVFQSSATDIARHCNNQRSRKHHTAVYAGLCNQSGCGSHLRSGYRAIAQFRSLCSQLRKRLPPRH